MLIRDQNLLNKPTSRNKRGPQCSLWQRCLRPSQRFPNGLAHRSLNWQKYAVVNKIIRPSFLHFHYIIISAYNVGKIISLSSCVPDIDSTCMSFIMLLYSEAQFRVKRMQCLLIQIEILSNACVLNLGLMGITKAKSPNEAIFSKVNAQTFQWRILYTWDCPNRVEGHSLTIL